MLRTELQEEDFQEADILWPDAGLDDEDDADDSGEYSSEHQPPMKLQASQKASSPIDIPGRKVVGAIGGARGAGVPAGFSMFGASHAGVGAGSVVVGSHVFVPPHVIVDRRAKRVKAMMMLAVPSGRVRARRMGE